MSKLSDLEKLIQLNGDDEKYSKGLQILNSGNLVPGNGRVVQLSIGVGLVALACILNPKLPANVRDAVLSIGKHLEEPPQIEEVEDTARSSESSDPPLPPEIKRDQPPLPPSPLPVPESGSVPPTAIYYSGQRGQSLVYTPNGAY